MFKYNSPVLKINTMVNFYMGNQSVILTKLKGILGLKGITDTFNMWLESQGNI